MRIASLFSLILLSAATLPAQELHLREHTVLAFNLPSWPKVSGGIRAPPAGVIVFCGWLCYPAGTQ